MSMLHIGTRCAACTVVDFLPTQCPMCSQTYCGQHIHAHECTSEPKPEHVAGPSTFVPKVRCEVAGCDRPTIEAIGGRTTEGEGKAGDGQVDIAKRVRCGVCEGAFCVSHRQQAAHRCPGPLDYTHRSDAAVLRKAKAQEILSKHFPGQSTRIVPKPPKPSSDIPLKRDRPRAKSPERLPPSLQPPVAAPTITPTIPSKEGEQKKGKTKNEKLYDIHLRKIRSLASPLNPKWTADSRERTFFEISSGLGSSTTNDVGEWERTGKWGKPDRVWVFSETPLGKVLDLLVERGKVDRVKNPDILSLVALYAPPNLPRQAVRLDLSSSSSAVPEGSLITLVRGWGEE